MTKAATTGLTIAFVLGLASAAPVRGQNGAPAGEQQNAAPAGGQQNAAPAEGQQNAAPAGGQTAPAARGRSAAPADYNGPPVRKVGATQSMMVNGRPVQRDMTPRTINGVVMVPIRFVADYLGASVDWQPGQRQVQITRGRDRLTMTMGATLATMNGQGRAMSAAPAVVEGRALLPLREVGRFFNADVQYNASTRTVFVNTLGGADSAPAMAPGAGLGTAGSSTGGTGAGSP